MVSKIRDYTLIALLLMLASARAGAACDDTLPVQGSRDDILVIVNDNSLDSCEVGRYYASQRGLGQNNIVHVATPALNWLSWDEFRNMMDQIIVYMQQPHMLKTGAPPAPVCSDGTSPYYCQASMDHLRAYTKVRYLVTTRGVPARSPIGGSNLWFPNETTSIDNYLSYWLVRYFPDNNNDGFSDDVVLFFKEREIAFGDGRGMRIVDPAADGELIVGRIEALDLASTKRLVDRIIDVEKNGVYGKHYGDPYGDLSGRAQWFDYNANRLVYGTASAGANADSWRYQYGIFGEDRQQCVDYLGFSAGSSSGKAPQDCVVKFADSTPGLASSRTPVADDALVYLGSLQGQASGKGSFATLLNWVHDTGCTVKLCDDAADPAACRAASTDAMGEFNTACVGVGDGFMGFNYQSFPVSYMTAWPTGWRGPGGGSNNYLSFPEVRQDSGHSDNTSIWFRNTDSIASPLCYASSDFTLPPSQPCTDTRRVNMYQYLKFANTAVDTVSPQQYQLSFWYSASNITEGDSLRVQFRVYETTTRTWVDYGNPVLATIPVGDTGWTQVNATLTLDPALHTAADLLFSQIEVRVNTGQYTGEVGFDDFSMIMTGTSTEMLVNTGFNEGFKEVSGGDHAAMYLSRLNGVGFWGSASHHQSGGHSFSANPQETLIYFFRGLPLGDAVWWGENKNSGMFYGDPVYSPVAVRFDYVPYDYVNGVVDLGGSAVNGRDLSLVTTSYSIDYCPGADFYTCDRNGTWVSTGLAGAGGQEDMGFGAWDTGALAFGQYTLRLAVTSNNTGKNRNQAFYDYYVVNVYDPLADDDGDGLSNGDELNVHQTNPAATDTDGDGLSDADEITVHGTDPLSRDSDGDGMPDAWEVNAGLQPTVDDAAADADGDGLTNLDEYTANTDPNNADSDGDGLSDGDEVNTHNTSPNLADSDFDGLQDGAEVAAGTDPLSSDTDADGMKDGYEVSNGLDPLVDDSGLDPDGDGLSNLEESVAASDPHIADTDGDGLNDGDEVNTHATSPTLPDTDFDRLTDFEEVVTFGSDPLSNTDVDGDHMSDDWENARGTDAARDDAGEDTDGDGAINILENLRGTLPLDTASVPAFVTLYVDAANSSGVEDGSQQNPFTDFAAAAAAANAGDTIVFATGTYASVLPPNGMNYRLVGPADRSAVLEFTVGYIPALDWAEIENITWNGLFGNSFLNTANTTFRNSRIMATGTQVSNARVRFENTVLFPVTPGSGTGLTIAQNADVTLMSCTIADFALAVSVTQPTGTLTARNSIIAATASLSGITDPAGLRYNLISDAQFAGVNGNLGGAAAFVDAANADYHVPSDALSIDAGDPADSFANEPANNGGRINIGAYGNTAEATPGNDTDGDGLSDQNEACHDGDCGSYDPWHAVNNPAGGDTDSALSDTDGDSYDDALEVSNGGDPLDAGSVPLVFTSAPVLTSETGFGYGYTATATWTGAQFNLVQGPAGMSIDPLTGVLTWNPGFGEEGSYTVSISVSSVGYTDIQTFQVDVSTGNNGDLNGDGQVDIGDLVLAQRIALGMVAPDSDQQVRGDVNADGSLSLADAVLIQKQILGL